MVFFPPNSDVAVVHSSQGRFLFLPNSDVAVVHSSQGRVLFFFTSYSQNWSYLVNKMISGPDFLKNDNIWSDFIKLDLL